MTKVNFKGLGVALITPFHRDGSVDFETLSRLVEFHLVSGTDYIVALGTTAETSTLSKKEKDEVSAFIVEKVNRKIPVVVGLGSNNTAELVEDLKHINFSGISGILSVTPYYNKPSQEGLYRHYCALSHASPLPIILYNVPGRTGVNMTAETTLRIARDCKNIVAVKEASGNPAQIKAIIDSAPEHFQVISGDDAMAAEVIALGGIGVISVIANAFPQEMALLVKNALGGDIESARRKLDADFKELLHLMFAEGSPAGVKCLMSLQGKAGNHLRLPLVPVSEKTQLEIMDALAKLSRISK